MAIPLSQSTWPKSTLYNEIQRREYGRDDSRVPFTGPTCRISGRPARVPVPVDAQSEHRRKKGADKFLRRTLVVRGLYPTAKYFARTGCWDETQHMMQDALKPVPVRFVPLAPAEPEKVPLEEMTDDFEGYEEIRTETDAGLESPDALVVAENAEDAAELACYDEEEREREAGVKKDEEDPS